VQRWVYLFAVLPPSEKPRKTRILLQ